jgi:hypothetical protein
LSQTDPTGLGDDPPLQTTVHNLMGAKCNAYGAYSGFMSNTNCALYMNATCLIDGLQSPCNEIINLLHNDVFEWFDAVIIPPGAVWNDGQCQGCISGLEILDLISDNAGNNGAPAKPLTPQQKQCLTNAKHDYNTAVDRAQQDANHTWWVDIRNSVGSGAVGGCVAGAVGGEGVGCVPGGAIGALGGWMWGVPAGLWDAINQFDTALGRAQEDYQAAQTRCVQ